jgi:hypothetical protein
MELRGQRRTNPDVQKDLNSHEGHIGFNAEEVIDEEDTSGENSRDNRDSEAKRHKWLFCLVPFGISYAIVVGCVLFLPLFPASSVSEA